MFIALKEFVEALGLPTPLQSGANLVLEDEEGDRRATLVWSQEGDIEIDVVEPRDLESARSVVFIRGHFDVINEGFDLIATDGRPEASDRNDVMSALTGFRNLTRNMTMVI